MQRYGSLPTAPSKQPGCPLTYQADGLITGQLFMRFDWALQKAQMLGNIGGAHPDEPLAVLYAAHLEKQRLNLGLCTYDCIGLYRDPTLRVVSGKPQVSTTPIEAHPKFTSTLAGTPAAPLNGAKFDDETGEFLGFFSGDLCGERSFFDGSVIVRASYYTRRPPTLQKAFTITTAVPNMPQVLGVTNWLQMPPDWEEVPQTGIFKVTDEFMGSGRRGWSTLTYGP